MNGDTCAETTIQELGGAALLTKRFGSAHNQELGMGTESRGAGAVTTRGATADAGGKVNIVSPGHLTPPQHNGQLGTLLRHGR